LAFEAPAITHAATDAPIASAELRLNLAVANQILFDHDLNDGYGHISARHDGDPYRFVMIRDMAPGTLDGESAIEFDLDGMPIPGRAGSCRERFIHGEIYKARPDVMAVVHTHASEMILFSVLSEKLRPLYQMSSFLGDGAPVFEIRDLPDRGDLLISDTPRGIALARSLGDHAVVLMRGHGASIVGSSLQEAIYRTIYAAQNARLQIDARRFGEATYLDDVEIAAIDQRGSFSKAWHFWKERALRRWSR
jgi:HCOMODA/2-hydroxy-3-carboxy-muconic semialdehyde decarboxylase